MEIVCVWNSHVKWFGIYMKHSVLFFFYMIIIFLFFRLCFGCNFRVPHFDIKAVNKTVYAPSSHPHISNIVHIHYSLSDCFDASILRLYTATTPCCAVWSSGLTVCAPTERTLTLNVYALCILLLLCRRSRLLTLTRDFCSTIEYHTIPSENIFLCRFFQQTISIALGFCLSTSTQKCRFLLHFFASIIASVSVCIFIFLHWEKRKAKALHQNGRGGNASIWTYNFTNTNYLNAFWWSEKKFRAKKMTVGFNVLNRPLFRTSFSSHSNIWIFANMGKLFGICYIYAIIYLYNSCKKLIN